jgi:hypothetical protein
MGKADQLSKWYKQIAPAAPTVNLTNCTANYPHQLHRQLSSPAAPMVLKEPDQLCPPPISANATGNPHRCQK